MPAKFVQQFWSRSIPDRQTYTNSKLNIPHYRGGDNCETAFISPVQLYGHVLLVLKDIQQKLLSYSPIFTNKL